MKQRDNRQQLTDSAKFTNYCQRLGISPGDAQKSGFTTEMLAEWIIEENQVEMSSISRAMSEMGIR